MKQETLYEQCEIWVRIGSDDFTYDITIQSTPCPMNLCPADYLWCLASLGLLGPQGGPRPIPSEISLATFRTVENLMAQTIPGQRLVELYREHGPEVTRLLRTETNLATAAGAWLREVQPGFRDLLAGSGTKALVNQTSIDRFNSILDQISAKASPGLAEAIRTERSRFNGLQDFSGQTLVVWANRLDIPAPTQPWIHLSHPRTSGTDFEVEANDIPGLSYTLWRSLPQSPANWEEVTNAVTRRDGYTVGFTDRAAPQSGAFYRVRAQEAFGAQ